MGVKLGPLIKRRSIKLEDLSGRALSIDAYNALYQFLSIIRGPNGEPLRDRRGRVTSHLCGLFYRTINLLERGIRPIYVFDGTPPSLKEAEIKRRMRIREEALLKYEEALSKGDLERARIYAQASAQLKDQMVNDAKLLLSLMGIPWIQAPSEGEAQAAYIVAKGDAWAVASQDFDSLLFGSPRLVRNVAITGRRKLPRKKVYVKISPEVIELEEVLLSLGLTREQLIDVAILIGTDFNPQGVRGIGPKTALRLITKHGSLEGALEELGQVEFPVEPSKIREIFLRPRVTDRYQLKWREPEVEEIRRFLCKERDFNEERVSKALQRVLNTLEREELTGLERYIA